MKSRTTIFEESRPGRRAYTLPSLDVPVVRAEAFLPSDLIRREPPGLPEVSEPEIARHFVNLSVLNHHVDRDLYPLGSCTMKYNPKVGEDVANFRGFSDLHPLMGEEHVQGALRLMHGLGLALCEITGMDDVTMVPAAGAHGELTGMLLVRAYHEDRGSRRSKVLIPDSSHGTNPASVQIAGYKAVEIKSDSSGRIDADSLKSNLSEDVAALMVTNPNTLGLFETDICEIAGLVHDAGGLVYMDGANMNALLGISRPGDFGIDMAHLNLHKTFSTPHGGGGPGSGPLVVKADLAEYLPVPVVRREGDTFRFVYDLPKSIGRIHTFYGNFSVLIKAYCYILMCGADGLREAAENAIINANYLLSKLRDDFTVPYGGACKHEFVLSGRDKLKAGVRTADIAKRLMDYGFHPPTVYFPLIVEEALMIEPTETESRETLDRFAEALHRISTEIATDPEKVKGAPYSTPVRRVDEATAARKIDVAE
ncbi:MAG: aminomethyl-transferring glycine dehydrogenase subunit GcvPB [Candidatus Eisenbacteria bacterium]